MLGITDQAQKASTAAARAESTSKEMRKDFDSFVSTFNNWKRSVNLESPDEPKKKKRDRRQKGGNGKPDDESS